MPIYEFVCPKCRVVFSFFSKRVQPKHLPICPKCGNKEMIKRMSHFEMLRGLKEPAAKNLPESREGPPTPDMDDPRIVRAMSELERDMEGLNENNPKHIAHMMRKMESILPASSMTKDMDTAIKRLEAGEDPEKIEEDMGNEFGSLLGPEGGEVGEGTGNNYTQDSDLYDY